MAAHKVLQELHILESTEQINILIPPRPRTNNLWTQNLTPSYKGEKWIAEDALLTTETIETISYVRY